MLASEIYAYIIIIVLYFVFLSYLIKYAHSAILQDLYLPKEDDFTKQYGYSYDLVLVIKVYDEDQVINDPLMIEYSFRQIMNRLYEAHLQCMTFYSCQMDEIYIKIRCKPEILKNEAKRIKYRLLLDHHKLRVRIMNGFKDSNDNTMYIWKPFHIHDD